MTRPTPIVLPPNPIRHFYAGGARIAGLRGFATADDHAPEEWIGAAVSLFGDPDRGLSRLPDGTLLRDAIAGDPAAFLGPRHVAAFGPDPALLVKLLDAGQRLPVHLHPDRAFARDALGSRWGKTEAWIILEAEPGASVHVGFAEEMDVATLRDWIRGQDAAAMLAGLRELPVAAGDVVFVPAGTPHAIGAGILLIELQEPSDFSLLLEWQGFPLSEQQAHLGLGWDRLLEAVDRSAWDDARLASVRGPAGDSLLPAAADPFFRADRVTAGSRLEQGFAILLVVSGEGAVATGEAELPVRRGDAVLIPYAAGDAELVGATAIRCRPPDL